VRRDNTEGRLPRDSRTSWAGAARPRRDFNLGGDRARNGGDRWPDAAFVEAEITRLSERWDSAIGELGISIPDTQLRALLIIDDSGALSPSRLAAALGMTMPGVSRLCDRMAASGLLTRKLAADTRREITLATTAAGQRLAVWIRGRRRAVLARELRSMSADGRRALARGLGELGRLRPNPDAGST
jgi:DNA-binding MarR family transcriptional regulator